MAAGDLSVTFKFDAKGNYKVDFQLPPKKPDDDITSIERLGHFTGNLLSAIHSQSAISTTINHLEEYCKKHGHIFLFNKIVDSINNNQYKLEELTEPVIKPSEVFN